MIFMPVRTIGIIGAGSIVFKSHLPLLTALGFDVRWVLDSVLARAKAAAVAFKVPMFLGADELATAPLTDLVLIACPYGSRQPYFEFLRGRECAIYIEKPVARSVGELEAICQLRPDYAVAAGFLRRSMGVTNMVKDIIADELFGRLLRVRSEFGTSTIISAGAGFAKNVELAGGGQLFESAIHNVDAVCFMADVQSAIVTRCMMEHEDGFDLHTDAQLTLTDSKGRDFEFELLVTCLHNTSYEIEMHFEHAILTFSLFRPMRPQVRVSHGHRSYQLMDPLRQDSPKGALDVTHVFLTDFLKGLETQTPNYTNACATRATTLIMEQLYERGKVADILVFPRCSDALAGAARIG
jgi:predicted dehydrogenase